MAKNKKNGVQDLIGLERFTNYGIKADKAEIVFFAVEPTNISVLSSANIEIKVHDLTIVLSIIPDLEIIMKELYYNVKPANNYDPDLSIEHISGLADYITANTILDVKVRNYIDEKCVRQVLAYHYLSTKRSDLNIKRVIVYDATSDRAVEVNIQE
ncbi:MAG: hypothetical protein IJM44_05630 [Ruminococcus sp.]|nr:hypothetical protein [Ruminococcus sp.]